LRCRNKMQNKVVVLSADSRCAEWKEKLEMRKSSYD